MIDDLTNTYDLAPLVVDLDEQIAYTRWLILTARRHGIASIYAWEIKKWEKTKNSLLLWLQGKRAGP